MNESTNPNNQNPILTLIQKIKTHELDPVGLSSQDRRRCVQVLYFEGNSTAEIGQFLHRSEKTIRRDIRNKEILT